MLKKKDLAFSFIAGTFNSPYYSTARASIFYKLGFNYHLSSKHLLLMNYLNGNHNYSNDIQSNAPTSYLNADGSNSQANYQVFSLLYRYKFVNNQKFSLTEGAGLSLMTQKVLFPYQPGTSNYLEESNWTSISFPINLNVSYKI